ncbi:hypothetical protein NKG05_07565 [Oerskovia sp. M15]
MLIWIGFLAAVVLVGTALWSTSDAAILARGGPELDLMSEYSSLKELEADASDVVVVEPTGESRTEHIGAAPFVVTEARVVSSGLGPLAAGTSSRSARTRSSGSMPPRSRRRARATSCTSGRGHRRTIRTRDSTGSWALRPRGVSTAKQGGSRPRRAPPRRVTITGTGDDLRVSS